ncbi:DUF975 family protein [Latilactobacillus fuchuensis]|uniref:Integral membrane protein n=1 Tax=Latilactobacillus fuchuensis TaxID=164393 RepID=A0A2N9DY58_9LACO|nr:DUF975 family protein [Latilactobacillus fuchuensis]SPC39802.1 conserved membrane hypothetical protein [Latilactobacillus fuchuensis]
MQNSTKTRAELKSEVKSLFAGHWGLAVRLNLVPVLLTILGLLISGMAIVALLAFFVTTPDVISSSADGAGSSASSPFGSTIGSFVVSLIMVGISFTSLDWLRTKEADFGVLKGAFSVFSKRYFLGVFVIQLLVNLFTFLWALLLIIPGIIKGYSYSQANLIFKDLTDADPEADVSYFDCITKSRKLMDGHKWRFFVLQLSFIGWDILACCTFGIGYIWLAPYKNATYAAFYKDLVD